MSWTFLLHTVYALGFALICGIVFERLRMHSLVGYMVAGIVVGPSVLNVVQRGPELLLLAEIGLALLLFTIGLEFSFIQLKRLGPRLLAGAVTSILALIVVVGLAAMAFGASATTALVLGSVVSLSSTAIALRILRERAELDHLFGRRAFGVLLTQDAFLIPLVVVVTFVVGGTAGSGMGQAFLGAALRTVGLIGALVVVTTFVVPRLLDERAVSRNRELPILLAVCTGVGATWMAHELKISPALGAFIAGMLLADSKFSDQMRADIYPLKVLFLTLFFVSIGLVADLGWIVANWALVLGLTVAVIFVKVLITHLSLRLFNRGIVDSLAAAIAVAGIGEFSFVLAQIGRSSGALSENVFQGVVSVSLMTLIAASFLVPKSYRLARRSARLLTRRGRGHSLAEQERAAHREAGPVGHVVVIGYGEAGQATCERLLVLGEMPVVLDMSPRFVRLAAERGLTAFVGDARQFEVLERVHLDGAKGVVVTIPDHNASRTVLRAVKTIAPDVRLAARARYHVHAQELDMVGADVVADEESLVGYRLADSVVAAPVVTAQRLASLDGPTEAT